MKILVIMGSPRKGNTFRACEDLHEQMQKDIPVTFEYLWLQDAHLLPCRGCLTCFTHGEETCPNKDDAIAIEQKMHQADAFIFASPVYGMNVTGQMKIFIDRFSYVFHRPRFFGKKAFLLVTTGVLGAPSVLSYLEKVARIWGCEVVGKVGLITPGLDSGKIVTKNEKMIADSARVFTKSLQNPRKKRPGLWDVIIFHGQRGAFSQLEKISPADYQYWKSRGWFNPGARYFTDVRVNPLYHGIGKILGSISARKIQKELKN
ncbi:MAG: flavodoxin family protein [Methanospirillaceae archaeon]|nr:flavodoxin family protein [Methanospirillaceae archaeon]